MSEFLMCDIDGDTIECERPQLKERIQELEEEGVRWARLVSEFREELNTQDAEIKRLKDLVRTHVPRDLWKALGVSPATPPWGDDTPDPAT